MSILMRVLIVIVIIRRGKHAICQSCGHDDGSSSAGTATSTATRTRTSTDLGNASPTHRELHPIPADIKHIEAHFFCRATSSVGRDLRLEDHAKRDARASAHGTASSNITPPAIAGSVHAIRGGTRAIIIIVIVNVVVYTMIGRCIPATPATPSTNTASDTAAATRTVRLSI